MKRRTLLKAGGLAAAAMAPLPMLFGRRNEGGTSLVADKHGVLDLRPGLTYRILQRALQPMTDGYRVPTRPDGMACFVSPTGQYILMRNHELDYTPAYGAYPGRKAPTEAYSARAQGGVTRLVVDKTTLDVKSSNLVLAGTLRNCGGGESPWGWLTCEEATDAGHGYVFACPSSAHGITPPRKIPGYGRYRHEAVCIDPNTHIAYLTEDQQDSCLYRFVPTKKSDPFRGKLQAMKLVGRRGTQLSREAASIGRVDIEWVDIAEPDPIKDTVRYQGHKLGAALVTRGEGIWFHAGSAYFVSTSGGKAGKGQIFRLIVGSGKQPDQLELVTESPGSHALDMPDNITVTPWGDLIIAEDGGGSQFIRGITPQGQLYDIARNAKSNGELAGVCLSPDGATLFFNMQTDGLTVAVRGPLRTIGASA
jgi:secreted PhoX family phosphatase